MTHIKDSDVCLHCGETRGAIKKHKLFCATVTYEGETDSEWPRHRFKPYSKKELEAMRKDEEEYIRQMQEFVEFVDNQACKKCTVIYKEHNNKDHEFDNGNEWR